MNEFAKLGSQDAAHRAATGALQAGQRVTDTRGRLGVVKQTTWDEVQVQFKGDALPECLHSWNVRPILGSSSLEDTATRASQFFSAASLEGKLVPPRHWLVRDLVPSGTVTLLGGDGGTGKSLLALQLACAVATGGKWLDRQWPAVAPCSSARRMTMPNCTVASLTWCEGLGSSSAISTG